MQASLRQLPLVGGRMPPSSGIWDARAFTKKVMLHVHAPCCHFPFHAAQHCSSEHEQRNRASAWQCRRWVRTLPTSFARSEASASHFTLMWRVPKQCTLPRSNLVGGHPLAGPHACPVLTGRWTFTPSSLLKSSGVSHHLGCPALSRAPRSRQARIISNTMTWLTPPQRFGE
jgi:hypothetical protein